MGAKPTSMCVTRVFYRDLDLFLALKLTLKHLCQHFLKILILDLSNLLVEGQNMHFLGRKIDFKFRAQNEPKVSSSVLHGSFSLYLSILHHFGQSSRYIFEN